MKGSSTIRMFFVLSAIGLVSCFLPMAHYTIGEKSYVTRTIDDYSGWGTAMILMVSTLYTGMNWFKQKNVSWAAMALLGVFLTGFSVFHIFHTLVIFRQALPENLAGSLNASAKIREGIILIGTTGMSLVFYALKHCKTNFQP
jgi:hypothetical protein